MGRTLVQRFMGDVRLVVRRAPRPTEVEFDEHISEAVARLDATRVVLVALVGDAGEAEFDAHQRAKLSIAGLFSRPHAVLVPAIRSELLLSRRWIGAQIRLFGPDAFQDACDFLEIDPSMRPELFGALVSAKEEVGRGAAESRGTMP